MIEEIIAKLTALLQGTIPSKIDMGKPDTDSEQQLGERLNQLIDFIQEIHDFIMPLSRGELHGKNIQSRNFLASPFKELHSRLLHLTWQATQVAKGDYEQRVDFMGDFSEAFNSMVVSLDRHEKLLKMKIDELENAISRIKKLEGILPICSNCKKIRLEGADPKKQDGWVEIESYIINRTEAQFTHGICPECMKKLYPDFMD
jgi:hypothetical protein